MFVENIGVLTWPKLVRKYTRLAHVYKMNYRNEEVSAQPTGGNANTKI